VATWVAEQLTRGDRSSTGERLVAPDPADGGVDVVRP
jgi:hypothetical protein